MKKVFLLFLCFWVMKPAWAISYSAADRHAKNAPEQLESMKDVVNYLIEPFDNDEEKARTIFTWIVFHVDYDKYKYNKTFQQKSTGGKIRANEKLETGDIFVTRIGVCQEIADLYTKMALMGGLDAATVIGYAGRNVTNQNKNQFRHAWNAVKIDGEWKLLDVTWAMQGDITSGSNIQSNSGHRREIDKRERGDRSVLKTRSDRRIDEQWFFPKPNDMIKTHYPDSEKWQLLTSPRSFSRFQKGG